MPYSACVIVGGSVVTYLNTNCSKIIRKAIATTGMNEYWMKDFSQPQNSQSSLRHDEERHEDRPEQRAHGARDQPEGDDRQRQRLRDRDEQQHRPVEQIREDGPGVRLHEVVGQLVEVAVDVVERTRLQHALEVERLVRDQVAERHAEARNRRLVERDHRVAERHEQQQLGELEHLVAQAVVGEHHPHALPADDDGRERRGTGCIRTGGTPVRRRSAGSRWPAESWAEG